MLDSANDGERGQGGLASLTSGHSPGPQGVVVAGTRTQESEGRERRRKEERGGEEREDKGERRLCLSTWVVCNKLFHIFSFLYVG